MNSLRKQNIFFVACLILTIASCRASTKRSEINPCVEVKFQELINKLKSQIKIAIESRVSRTSVLTELESSTQPIFKELKQQCEWVITDEFAATYIQYQSSYEQFQHCQQNWLNLANNIWKDKIENKESHILNTFLNIQRILSSCEKNEDYPNVLFEEFMITSSSPLLAIESDLCTEQFKFILEKVTIIRQLKTQSLGDFKSIYSAMNEIFQKLFKCGFGFSFPEILVNRVLQMTEVGSKKISTIQNVLLIQLENAIKANKYSTTITVLRKIYILLVEAQQNYFFSLVSNAQFQCKRSIVALLNNSVDLKDTEFNKKPTVRFATSGSDENYLEKINHFYTHCNVYNKPISNQAFLNWVKKCPFTEKQAQSIIDQANEADDPNIILMILKTLRILHLIQKYSAECK